MGQYDERNNKLLLEIADQLDNGGPIFAPDWLAKNQVTIDELSTLREMMSSYILGALALRFNERVEFIVRGELEFGTR